MSRIRSFWCRGGLGLLGTLLLAGTAIAQETSRQASDLGGPLTRPDPAALQAPTLTRLEVQSPDQAAASAPAPTTRPAPRPAEDPTGGSRTYGGPNASSTVFQNGFNRINIRW